MPKNVVPSRAWDCRHFKHRSSSDSWINSRNTLSAVLLNVLVFNPKARQGDIARRVSFALLQLTSATRALIRLTS